MKIIIFYVLPLVMVVCQTSAKPEHQSDNIVSKSKSLSQQQKASSTDDDLEKRSAGWAKAGSMWGKRSPYDIVDEEQEGDESPEDIQKRGWEKAGSMWGKRATNTWGKASSMWGKRAPNTWSKASSMWGKRQLINNILDNSNPSAERK